MYFSHSYLYIWRWKISLSYLFMGKYRELMVRPGGNWCNGINNVLKLCNWPYYVFLDTWNELYTARNTINISNIPNFEWFSEKMKTRFSSEMRVRLKFFDLPKILHASLYMDIAQLVGVIPGSDEVRGKWITLIYIYIYIFRPMTLG